MNGIGENVDTVRQRIAAAADRADRSPDEVALMAVSKTVDPRRIDEALDAGIGILGESRVQEAEEKIPRVAGEAEWHLVGRLQSNKARLAAALFDAIHSVDRAELAERLADVAGDHRDRSLGIYVQVGSGTVFDGGADEAVLEICRTVAGADALKLEGLMVMPPYDPDPEAARPYFQGLRSLRDRLREAHSDLEIAGLSMGMTADFEIAVEEGATIVRVGTAIFGARPT